MTGAIGATHNAEPRKYEIDYVVARFDHEENLPSETVTGPQNLSSVGNSVCRSEKRSIEPPSTLDDKLWQRVWDVGFSDRSLDIFENPSRRYGGSDGRQKKAHQLEFALATSSKHRIR